MTLDPAVLMGALLGAAGLVIAMIALLSRGANGPNSAASADRAALERLERLERLLREELHLNRVEAGSGAQSLGLVMDRRFEALAQTLDQRTDKLAGTVGAQLEEIRQTVDEKLHGALEQRLSESFRTVSERLEQVHRGLGEMQVLAAGVGDLKRVLTNVKTRGIWGETRLAALLEDILTPDQYRANVAPKDNSSERVEFVIRLPGREDGVDVWLPIDAKFPREDYERLVEAAERGDAAAVEAAAKGLELRLRQCAKDIRDKYLAPPRTTDFALLFLPSEGLHAEALRRPGLIDALQREYRVIPTGPTTLAALLNSLQMGFRTLAIERRSSEVWELLGAVKVEFARYGEILDKVQRKLVEASQQIDQVAVRKRAVDRKLRAVQGLEPQAVDRLLGDLTDPLPPERGAPAED